MATERTAPAVAEKAAARQSVFDGIRAVWADPVLRGINLAIQIRYLGFIGALKVGIAGFAQITLAAGPTGQGILLAVTSLCTLGVYPISYALAGLVSSLGGPRAEW